MANSRQYHLDIIAGILIIFMVIHHVLPFPVIDAFLSRFLFFYMPWFFFKAGMFFNPQKSSEDTFKSSVRRLLVPYAVFFVIGQVIIAIQLFTQHNLHLNYLTATLREFIYTGAAWGNGPLWFLFSLFMVRMIFSIIGKYSYGGVLITVVSISCAWFIHIFGIALPLYVGNVCLGCFFYGLGYLIKDVQYHRASITLCTIGYIFTVAVFPILGSFVNNSSDYYLWWIVASIMAIITYNGGFKMVKWNMMPLQFCGVHSLEILVSHMPIFNLVSIFRFALQ